jgi:5-methylcytosine-specific restriction protein A
MFVKGRSYIRREIHNEFGGQQQSGISTPTEHPLILIFTGEQGEQYGYRDGWTEDGVFLYTGQGQQGDMEFSRGNRAVRDHIENGKDLHLFKYVDHGTVRYLGQMVYAGFEIRQAPDIDGNLRSAIVFELLPIEAFNPQIESEAVFQEELENSSLEELRRRAIDDHKNPRPPRESKQAAHYRSSAVRLYVLKRASSNCEACEEAAPFKTVSGRPYLEPHHIRRISDGGPDHPEWVAGVCPNCHSRAHYSVDKDSFNDRLKKVISEKEKNIKLDA